MKQSDELRLLGQITVQLGRIEAKLDAHLQESARHGRTMEDE